MPCVSVIIPTYNRQKYIARALASILSQDYQDFEIIVVDDGSSDNTRRVVEEQERGTIRYVYQDNAGPGAARNHGIRISQGKYLTFLDSDDMWMPTFLSTTVPLLDTHAEVGVVTTGIYVGPTGSPKKQACLEGVKTGVWELPPRFAKRRVHFALDGFVTGTVLARREIITRYGGFYEHRCTLGEDVYLWMQVLLNHKTYHVREPLAWYDTGASSLSFTSGRTHYPLEPILTDPEPIWRNCPPRYREFLSCWMACHALKSIHTQIATGDCEKARWLLEHYPLVRTWRWDWLRIQFKLAFPSATTHLRRVKSSILIMHDRINKAISRS